jgi:soluble lytic murein transglycosylase-like protein
MFIARALLIAGIALAMPVAAQSPTPFSEFSAKRIKAPPPGSRPKITVQIDPAAQVPAPRAKPTEAPKDETQVPLGRFAWFWDQISPSMDASGPGRLDVALAAISGSDSMPAPRLQSMQDIATARGISILRSTIGTDVSPALVLAVIAVESAGKADAVSGAGAQGLMQLMPDTAERFGVLDSLIAEDNIKGGVKYLNWLMQEFESDPILVLAGYNAGEGSVRTHKGVPPYAETRDYVPKVLAAFQVAKGLCATPPELISDGCVFATMN